jgi:probable rRNA maturation factor
MRAKKMAETPDITVSIDSPAWDQDVPTAEDLCRRAAAMVFQVCPPPPTRAAEAGIVLADDATVRTLNRHYRGQDKPTNVLSFANMDDDGDPFPAEAPILLGDVIVAHGTAAGEAATEGKTLSDHLAHLIVHGMLHLLGHDHGTDQEALDMEALEINILSRLGISDPYGSG